MNVIAAARQYSRSRHEVGVVRASSVEMSKTGKSAFS